jgi:hypothetical protein
MFPTFKESLLLFHALPESFQIFVDFLDLLATALATVILVRDFLVKILDAKLHL